MTRGVLRRKLADVLAWRTADKVALLAVAIAAFIAWYGAVLLYLVRHPGLVPYTDPSGLRAALVGVIVLEVVWLAFAAVAIGLRRARPEASILAHGLVLGYFATVVFGGYELGVHTTPLVGTLVVGGVTIGLVLLPARPVLIASSIGVVLLTGLTVAEQLRLIPYAPLLREAPFHDGHLALSWLLTMGSVTFVVVLVQLTIVCFIILRWKEREETLARASELISRYLASQLVEQLRAGNYEALERRERRKLTILFADVEDFTSIADELEPEDLAALLNDYLSEMTEIGTRYGATVDKFVGDAIMAFFGAPMPIDDREQALRAVRMAIAMQSRMEALRTAWSRRGFERVFQIRVGINTGQASVGNFGSKQRLDYTAIGRQVNLAARLQAQCEPGRVLVSHATWLLVQDEIPCTPRGEVILKGFLRPVPVYEVAEQALVPAA